MGRLYVDAFSYNCMIFIISIFVIYFYNYHLYIDGGRDEEHPFHGIYTNYVASIIYECIVLFIYGIVSLPLVKITGLLIYCIISIVFWDIGVVKVMQLRLSLRNK